jgi:hypothetical protein
MSSRKYAMVEIKPSSSGTLGSNIYRCAHITVQQPPDSLDQIFDVAKRPSLGSIAEYGQRLAAKCLVDESGHYTPILRAHPWSVGVEDSDDSGVHRVDAIVGHDHGFREAFSFVVNPSRPHRVNVTPIAFRLGVHQRVAVDF